MCNAKEELLHFYLPASGGEIIMFFIYTIIIAYLRIKFKNIFDVLRNIKQKGA